jgi:hypothetical protein
MSTTVVVRSREVAGYGRHAAPLSAYGPSDVHRLLPAPPSGSREAERADPEDALVEVVGHAVRADVVAVAEDAIGGRSSGDSSKKPRGFWPRLHLLPKAA